MQMYVICPAYACVITRRPDGTDPNGGTCYRFRSAQGYLGLQPEAHVCNIPQRGEVILPLSSGIFRIL